MAPPLFVGAPASSRSFDRTLCLLVNIFKDFLGVLVATCPLCCASFASNLFIGRCKSSSWCIAWGLFLCYHFKKRSNGHARIHGNLLIKLVWSSSMKCVTAIAFTNLTRRDEQYCNLSNIQNSCCDLLWQFRFNGKIPSYAPVRKGCTKHCCAKTDRILVMAMVLEEWLVRISTLCRVLKPWAP